MGYQTDIGEDGIDCDNTTPLPLEDGKVCNFKVSTMGVNCTAEQNYGYGSGAPCIILELNRMIGWKPQVYETLEDLPKDLPPQLDAHIRNQTELNGGVVPKMLWVSCRGENPMDNEMLGYDIDYLPFQGFPYYYFPYMNQKNYRSPLIAVQLKSPKTNILTHISC